MTLSKLKISATIPAFVLFVINLFLSKNYYEYSQTFLISTSTLKTYLNLTYIFLLILLSINLILFIYIAIFKRQPLISMSIIKDTKTSPEKYLHYRKVPYTMNEYKLMFLFYFGGIAVIGILNSVLNLFSGISHNHNNLTSIIVTENEYLFYAILFTVFILLSYALVFFYIFQMIISSSLSKLNTDLNSTNNLDNSSLLKKHYPDLTKSEFTEMLETLKKNTHSYNNITTTLAKNEKKSLSILKRGLFAFLGILILAFSPLILNCIIKSIINPNGFFSEISILGYLSQFIMAFIIIILPLKTKYSNFEDTSEIHKAAAKDIVNTWNRTKLKKDSFY